MIIALSGPSGVGKNSILLELAKHVTDSVFSVSCTTRDPRPGEVNGQHYNFISNDEFDRMIEDGKFVEWKQYGTSRYGTPSEPIRESINNDMIIFMDLEVEGAVDLRTFCHDNNIILFDFFIMPPNMDVLKERLLKRGSEDQKAVENRVRRGCEEMQRAGEFTHTFINEDLSRCVQEILDEFWF